MVVIKRLVDVALRCEPEDSHTGDKAIDQSKASISALNLWHHATRGPKQSFFKVASRKDSKEIFLSI